MSVPIPDLLSPAILDDRAGRSLCLPRPCFGSQIGWKSDRLNYDHRYTGGQLGNLADVQTAHSLLLLSKYRQRMRWRRISRRIRRKVCTYTGHHSVHPSISLSLIQSRGDSPLTLAMSRLTSTAGLIQIYFSPDGIAEDRSKTTRHMT